MNCKLVYFTLIYLLTGCAVDETVDSSSKKEEDTKPHNILLIIVDDLRPELGCYGSSLVKSPNIDRIAAEGSLFLNAYANVPVCGASRASFLTGLRPVWPDRFTSFNAYADKDSPEAITLPAHFKNNGYYTVSNGKVFHNLDDSKEAWSEAPWRSLENYGSTWADYNVNDLWQDPASASLINPNNGRGPYYEFADISDTAYNDGKMAEKTIADLKRLKSKEQPFLLACGFWKPHLPLIAPVKYWDMYDPGSIEIADNRYRPHDMPVQSSGSGEIKSYGNLGTYNSEAFHRNTRHAYYACVSYIDAQIGKIVDELEQLELDKNTIIVVMGDHGWNLGEHNFWGKHNLLDNSLRSPLIIKVPGQQPELIADVVEFVDIYPTLCDLAGLPAPSGLAGENLFQQGAINLDQSLAFAQWKRGQSVISNNYIYTEWKKDGQLINSMLFDHQNDPQENYNVVKNPEYSAVVKEYKSYLTKHTE